MTSAAHEVLRSARVLAGFAAVCTLLIVGTYRLTAKPIADIERQTRLQRLQEVLPPQYHDNDLLADSEMVEHPLLSPRGAVRIYHATRNGRDSGTVVESLAPDGYSGDIRLLIGIAPDGTLTGVRVLQHQETPGLGDRIELAKSDWVLGFDGRSLRNPTAENWAISPDGGVFDAFSGASITPRAVVGAVYRALDYHAGHRDP